MNNFLRTLILSAIIGPTLPILAYQGKRVRQKTPRLPEASGSCRGHIEGRQPAYHLLMLGESPVAGVGLSHYGQALTAQTAKALHQQSGQAVEWWALGKNGATAAALNGYLTSHHHPQPVDAVVIVLGVNDTTSFHTPPQWARDLGRLIEDVRHHSGDCPIVIAGVPPLGHFPTFPQPLRFLLGFWATVLDVVAQEVASRYPQVTHCPTPPAPLDSFAPDGFHPGVKGARLWGTLLARHLAST